MIPRLHEYFNQIKTEVVSNSRNKINQVWGPLSNPPLYSKARSEGPLIGNAEREAQLCSAQGNYREGILDPVQCGYKVSGRTNTIAKAAHCVAARRDGGVPKKWRGNWEWRKGGRSE